MNKKVLCMMETFHVKHSDYIYNNSLIILIVVLTTCFGRHEIFKLFLNSLPKDAYLICVGDEGENQDSFYQFNVQYGLNGQYVIHENKPLGKKWNHGLQIAKDLKFEHLVITGSDDIFSEDLWDFYQTLNVHYAGLLDLYFLDHPTGRIKYNNGFSFNRKGEPHGAGRALHRTVLEHANWKLWEDEINIGLDASMTKTLKRFLLDTHFINVKEKGFVAMDIKNGENLHTINEYKGRWIAEDEKIWVLKKLGWA